MKMVTYRVREFEDNDVVLDRAWFSVGIRRMAVIAGGESQWFVTPHTTSLQNREVRVYTDTEMMKFIEDGDFVYVGGYFDLRENAPKED